MYCFAKIMARMESACVLWSAFSSSHLYVKSNASNHTSYLSRVPRVVPVEKKSVMWRNSPQIVMWTNSRLDRLSCGKNSPYEKCEEKMCTIHDVLSHFMLFCCKIVIYVVLSRYLFCCNLSPFAWRKNAAKNCARWEKLTNLRYASNYTKSTFKNQIFTACDKLPVCD